MKKLLVQGAGKSLFEPNWSEVDDLLNVYRDRGSGQFSMFWEDDDWEDDTPNRAFGVMMNGSFFYPCWKLIILYVCIRALQKCGKKLAALQ